MTIAVLKKAAAHCLPAVFAFGSVYCVYGQSFGTVTLPKWLADSGVPVQRAAASTPALNQWAEGPVIARNGTAFFSEQLAGNIWKVSAAGVMTKLVTVTSGTTNYVNGLDFNPIDGNLVVCEQARITERDTTDGHVIKVITSGATWGQGANDLTFASNGDLFFTCFNQHIFFHSADSSVNIDWNFTVPANCEWNGIEYIEEKGIIYLCQYGQNQVLTFKVSPTTHLIDTSTKKTFASVMSPDGITVDSLYDVYVASNSTGGTYPESIVAYDSSGTALGSIHMIQKLPSTSLNTTNSVFGNFPFGGGPNPKTLYITGDSGLFKVQLKVAGRVRPGTTAVKTAKMIAGHEFFSIHGTTLQVKGSGTLPIAVAIFSADSRMVKKFSTQRRTIDLHEGLKTGCYLVRAEIQGQRITARMAVLQ